MVKKHKIVKYTWLLLILLFILLIVPIADAAVTTVSYTKSSTDYLNYTFTSDATVDYLWTFDDGTTYNTQNCSHTFIVMGPHWVNMSSESTYIVTNLVVEYQFDRPLATDAITYEETGAMDVIQNNGTFSVESIVEGISLSYTVLLGNFFYFIVFGTPIIMIWIRTDSIVIPTILGMFIGSFSFEYLPPEYEYAAMVFMVLSIAGMLTVIFKTKK